MTPSDLEQEARYPAGPPAQADMRDGEAGTPAYVLTTGLTQ